VATTVTPSAGQSLVIYEGTRVLGQATIAKRAAEPNPPAGLVAAIAHGGQ